MDKLLDKPTYEALTTSVTTLQKRLDLIYQIVEQEAKRKAAAEAASTPVGSLQEMDRSDVLSQVLQTVKEMTSGA